MKDLLQKLAEKKDLTRKEARGFIDLVAKNELIASHIAFVLAGLRIKGETTEEIVGCIEGMREHMLPVGAKGTIIDTCGTGGDGKQTFNISTAVAFVVAGAGVPVAKHGNKAASSKCGSADVLEALGVHVLLSPMQAEAVLAKVGMVFLFAPLFHPAMKSVALVRRELGVRTIFNVLGPFTNPAKVKRQIIGVPTLAVAEKLAKVATQLEYEHLLIVTAENGMDEISTTGKTHIFEIKGTKTKQLVISGKQFGLRLAKESELQGGSVVENAQIITKILAGEKSAKRDIVLLNAAYALFVAGKVTSVKEGIQLAQESIDSGKAKEVLEKLREETTKYAQ